MTIQLVKLDYYTQLVFFATDRNLLQLPADSSSFDKVFGTQQVTDLTFGKAEVSIPKVGMVCFGLLLGNVAAWVLCVCAYMQGTCRGGLLTVAACCPYL